MRVRQGERGQSLVEFALAFPIFLLILIGLIEFAFLGNALLAISFAVRDASAIAAQSCGDGSCGIELDYRTADCQILRSIERNITAPATPERITQVSVYWTDTSGHVQKGGLAVTRYTRTGTTECTDGDTIPYSLVTDGYPQSERCSILSGCTFAVEEGGEHTGLDVIGVQITYDYPFVTPYAALFGLFDGNGALILTRGAEMRMEPTL
jgi:Flp pilus assembly protein TadG